MALSSFQAWQTSRHKHLSVLSCVSYFCLFSLLAPLFFFFLVRWGPHLSFSTEGPTVDLRVFSRASSSQNSSLSLTEDSTEAERVPLQSSTEGGRGLDSLVNHCLPVGIFHCKRLFFFLTRAKLFFLLLCFCYGLEST